MKINTRRLRRIIQEEISRLHEAEGQSVESYVAQNIDPERLAALIHNADAIGVTPEEVYEYLLLILDDAMNATMPSGRPDRVFRGGVEV